MYFRLIKNDVLKSKAITMTTLVMIAAAAMLVSLAAVLVVNLTGAIDTLMTQGKTPHFMQMHSGEIDVPRLQSFAQQNENVDEFQVLEFLNVDGARIVIGGNSLADSVQDNGFSVQSERFDFLLDLDGNPIQSSAGELYVPIFYMRNKDITMGDKAIVGGTEFTVAGFLRDSQMNSTLSSSKRFLVSLEDYEYIKQIGSVEYLIEFRLKDLSGLGAFETAYAAAGLEANGPTITYPLFRVINGLSDGLMIAVILLISALIVVIAFMCLRLTLLAKIEDDYREIGVMKAIGLRVWDIKKTYLAKYASISVVGCLLGYALSFVFRDALLQNIRVHMGESGSRATASLLAIVGVVLVFSSIMIYVIRVLNRFRKISAAEAIRFSSSQEPARSSKFFTLNANRVLSTNGFLGIKDVLARRGLYITLLAVLVVSTFIIHVPQNLYNTISSKGFINYMGIGGSDMRVDIQQTQGIAEKAAEISAALEMDRAKHVLLTTRIFRAKTQAGWVPLKIEIGDHRVFPIEYSVGRAPEREDEIALSAINAEELGVRVGDILEVMIRGEERRITVSGVYSDITNGGKTAKAVFHDDAAEIMWCILYAEFAGPSNEKIAEYAQRFDYAKVTGVDDYVKQTFGSTISSVGIASRASVAIALVVTLIVTLLFMRMLIAKDRHSIAVMKAMGFTQWDITKQYVWRSLFVLVAGVSLGTVLANTWGESLAGMIISWFGVSSFRFEINPLHVYLFHPFIMVALVLLTTVTSTVGAGRIAIPMAIKE